MPKKTKVNGIAINMPDAPAWIQSDPEALSFWQEYAPRAAADERLKPDTMAAFTALCRYWSRWKAAEAKVAEIGPVIKSAVGQAQRSPYAIESEKCWKAIMPLFAQFNLLPPRY